MTRGCLLDCVNGGDGGFQMDFRWWMVDFSADMAEPHSSAHFSIYDEQAAKRIEVDRGVDRLNNCVSHQGVYIRVQPP